MLDYFHIRWKIPFFFFVYYEHKLFLLRLLLHFFFVVKYRFDSIYLISNYRESVREVVLTIVPKRDRELRRKKYVSRAYPLSLLRL